MFKEIIKKIVSWFVTSSEDPSKMALTLKGIIVTGIPYLVMILGVFHITVPSESLLEIGNGLVLLFQTSLTVIGIGMTVYGLIRKIVNSSLIPWPTDPTVVAKIGAPEVK